MNPGETETPDNGRDDDCLAGELCYLDADNDGYRPDGTAGEDGNHIGERADQHPVMVEPPPRRTGSLAVVERRTLWAMVVATGLLIGGRTISLTVVC